jgi:hypothetical protein
MLQSQRIMESRLQNFIQPDDDSEGEFEELDADDPRWMDDMDIMRPSRITPSQRYTRLNEKHY